MPVRYSPWIMHFNNRGWPGQFNRWGYLMANRRANRPARKIQGAWRRMLETRRYNMVRRNPMMMVRRYQKKKYSRKRKYY